MAGIGAGIEAGVPADETIIDPYGDCAGSTFVIFIGGTFPEDMLTNRCCFSMAALLRVIATLLPPEHPGDLRVHRPAPHA